MDALGYEDGVTCFASGHEIAKDLAGIVELYRKGGYINKAKAMGELAAEMKTIIHTLESCSSAATDVEQYAKLVNNLNDPRYYTTQNALTLALNVAEDRVQLEQVVSDVEKGDEYAAGHALMLTILDVLENPGIPSSNGTAAVQIARGFAHGFVEDVNLKCFQDAKAEVPSVIGGVLACMSGVGLIPGLELVFHALTGLVPFLKDCYDERSQIKNILLEFTDFRHPLELAKRFGHNIVANGIDISLELASATLDIQGKNYERLGEDVGKILSKILVLSDKSSVVV